MTAGPPPIAVAAATSMRRNSAARLLADVIGILLVVATGVFTARVLGPGVKGTLSSLLYLSVLAVHVSSLGLGDASIILVGRGEVDLRRVAGATYPVVLASGALAGVVVFLIGPFLLGSDVDLTKSSAVAGVAVVGGVLVQFTTQLLNARERLFLTSVVLAVNALVTAVVTVVLVSALDLAVLGGVAAGVVGAAVVLPVLLVALVREAGRPSLRVDRPILTSALRVGLPIQVSYVLVALSQRMDQLLVIGLAGRFAAGRYAVALTIGQLSMYPAVALSMATFPRLATLDEAAAQELTMRATRMTVIMAALVAVPLAVLAVPGVPIVFGDEYRGAIGPSIVSLAAGGIAALQWVLARALAARRQPRALVASYLVSLATMLAIDIAIVPDHGPMGAAIGNITAAAAGLIVCILVVHRRWRLHLRDLVPHRREVHDLLAAIRSPRSLFAGPDA